ncbi:OmpW/AlkL family protein [Carnimonas bestiolae]|uniref:OmpW/AlkL family protein n=1 Tax=Carnimonas bestiolae TaxID=3402172 RepID=UPI003EDC1FC4
MKLKLIGLAVAAAATAFTSTSAMAYGGGDFWVRGGLAFVRPTGGHTNLNGDLSGARVEKVQNDHGFAFTLGYRFTDQFGMELLAAPESFKHDFNVKSGSTKAASGSVHVLPPTLTAQYYPLGGTSSQVQPYVGAGLAYARYSSEHINNGLDIHMGNAWGWAAQAGVDYMLTDNLGVNAAVWYIESDPNTRVSQNGQTLSSKRLDVNPVVVMTGLTWRF